MPMNATSSMSTMSSIPGYTPLIVITICVALLISLAVMPQIIKSLMKIANFLKKTFGYFFYGVGGLTVFAGMYYFIKMNVEQVKGGNPLFLKISGLIIGSYCIISFIGFIVKKVFVDRFIKSYKKAKKDLKEVKTK